MNRGIRVILTSGERKGETGIFWEGTSTGWDILKLDDGTEYPTTFNMYKRIDDVCAENAMDRIKELEASEWTDDDVLALEEHLIEVEMEEDLLYLQSWLGNRKGIQAYNKVYGRSGLMAAIDEFC